VSRLSIDFSTGRKDNNFAYRELAMPRQFSAHTSSNFCYHSSRRNMSQLPEPITDQINQPAKQQWCYSKHYIVKSYNWDAFVDHFKNKIIPKLLGYGFRQMKVWTMESGEDYQVMILIPLPNQSIVNEIIASGRMSGGEVWNPDDEKLIESSQFFIMRSRPDLSISEESPEGGELSFLTGNPVSSTDPALFDSWLKNHVNERTMPSEGKRIEA
jgi:hypothetical protein